jgi:hypothetical protein
MPETEGVTPQPDARRSRKREYAWRHPVEYTEAQWKAVKAAAEACGKPVGRYIRETSLGALPKPLPHRADAALIRELGRCAMALVRLADAARASGALPDASTLEAGLAELLATVRGLASVRQTSRAPR